MKIKKTLSFSNIKDPVLSGIQQNKNTMPDDRIFMLEELRIDIGKMLGYDYSRRFKRLITFAKRK